MGGKKIEILTELEILAAISSNCTLEQLVAQVNLLFLRIDHVASAPKLGNFKVEPLYQKLSTTFVLIIKTVVIDNLKLQNTMTSFRH